MENRGEGKNTNHDRNSSGSYNNNHSTGHKENGYSNGSNRYAAATDNGRSNREGDDKSVSSDASSYISSHQRRRAEARYFYGLDCFLVVCIEIRSSVEIP